MKYFRIIFIAVSSACIFGLIYFSWLYVKDIQRTPDGTFAHVETMYPISESATSFTANQGLNRAATTTIIPEFTPDNELLMDGVRLIAPNTDPRKVTALPSTTWVFVEKNHQIHAEAIYDNSIIRDAATSTRGSYFVNGGIVYGGDLKSKKTKFFLTDRGALTQVADPATFAFVDGSEDYLKDKQQVYFLTSGNGPFWDTSTFSITPIVAADAASFKILNAEALLAQDAHFVYQNGEVVPNINLKTFAPAVAMANNFYKDATWLYYFGLKTAPSINIRHGYFEKYPLSEILTKKVKDGNSLYTQDEKSVFYSLEQIRGADPKSFVLLSGYLGVAWQTDVQYNYAKDMSHVYYQGYPITGAEVSTFHPIENGSFFHTYAADAARVYFGTSTILLADPETFVTLWNNINGGCSFGMYSKDTRHVYFRDEIVTGADTQSFKPLINGYGVDKRGIYKEGVFQPQLPKSFKPECNYG